MKKFALFLRLLGLLPGLFLLFLASIATADIGIVDQQNLTFTGIPGNGTLHDFGQSFVPTLTGIDAFDYDLRVVTGDPVTGVVQLQEGVTGPDGLEGIILGTSSPVTISGSSPQMYEFDFPTTVSLTPGNLYVAHFVGLPGTGVVGVVANDTFGGVPDSYPAGQFLEPNVIPPDTRFDAVFKEGVVPEPSVIALLAISGILALVIGRRASVVLPPLT